MSFHGGLLERTLRRKLPQFRREARIPYLLLLWLSHRQDLLTAEHESILLYLYVIDCDESIVGLALACDDSFVLLILDA